MIFLSHRMNLMSKMKIPLKFLVYDYHLKCTIASFDISNEEAICFFSYDSYRKHFLQYVNDCFQFKNLKYIKLKLTSLRNISLCVAHIRDRYSVWGLCLLALLILHVSTFIADLVLTFLTVTATFKT